MVHLVVYVSPAIDVVRGHADLHRLCMNA